MPSSHSLSRTASFASQEGSKPPNNAALLGAATAFGRPSAGSRNPSSTSSIRPNGALAAASSAGLSSKMASPSQGHHGQPSLSAQPQATSPIDSATDERAKETGTLDLQRLPTLTIPLPQRTIHSRSPSHQAAVTATARAPPLHIANTKRPGAPRANTSQRPVIAPKPRRLSQNMPNNDAKSEKPTDTTSIAPTTSLVDLFEGKLDNTSTKPPRRPGMIIVKPGEDVSIRSPKPVKPGEGITSMFHMELEDMDETPSVQNRPPAASQRGPGQSTERVRRYSGEYFASSYTGSHPYSPHLAESRRNSLAFNSSPATVLRSPDDANERQLKLSPSPGRQKSSSPHVKPSSRSGSMQSDAYSATAQSLKTIPAQFNHAYPRKMTPLTTGDELANALVASSLASSRAVSPRKMEPPPPPTRRKKHNHPHHHHHHGISLARTPSPAKTGMLHTLRAVESSDSESDGGLHPYSKHMRKRLVRKHPNKHHEGDRKRWRDAVTERERQRYEGVWAANKGLFNSFTSEEQQLFAVRSAQTRSKEIKAAVSDQVSNIVARDIWLRSRLPDTVLETVWDLVDNDSVGRLRKEEFVVGMWLIDQRLKGRKLPVKVSETVWASVRGLTGIKIRK